MTFDHFMIKLQIEVQELYNMTVFFYIAYKIEMTLYLPISSEAKTKINPSIDSP